MSRLNSINLTGISIRILEKVCKTKPLSDKMNTLRALPEGTVGRSIADMLDRHGYRLIPRFQNHDLKHIVLGYEMIKTDEILMQAYLVGNGNYTIPCMLFLMNAVFYPSIWPQLIPHYRMGRSANSILHITLEGCMYRDLAGVIQQYGRNSRPS